MTEPGAAGGREIGAHLLGVTVTWRYRLEWIMVRILVKSLFRVRAEGLDRWPTAPFQLSINHHSGWDPMLVLAISPLRPRITWFGPKEVNFSKGFKNRVMGFFGGMIPFNPSKTNLGSSVRAVQRVFDSGGVLAIAAEGTLGFREAELLPLQDGATVFAALSGVPVLPGVIVGSSTLWFRKEIVVRFGEPIAVSRGGDREVRARVAEQVRAGMAALLPDREPVYPDRRPGSVFLTDLFNGPGEKARWRKHMAEVIEQASDSDPRMLPFIWALMVFAVVGGFVMIVAYWLDIQDRNDLGAGAKMRWSAGILIFPVTVPLYAFAGGGRWPTLLKVASFIPAVALTLFLLFVFGVLG